MRTYSRLLTKILKMLGFLLFQLKARQSKLRDHLDSLAQNCGNFITNKLELLQSCTCELLYLGNLTEIRVTCHILLRLKCPTNIYWIWTWSTSRIQICEHSHGLSKGTVLTITQDAFLAKPFSLLHFFLDIGMCYRPLGYICKTNCQTSHA